MIRAPRRILLPLAALLLVALAVDLTRPPPRQLTARALLGLVHLHQAIYAPLLERIGARCRFIPSCSRYGATVIRRYGALRGGWLALWRVLRCGPWTPQGTRDPAPGGPPQPARSRR
jgi:uncharacterized protein